MAGGTTRTVRFDKDLDEALQTIARNERVSVNSIVNGLVRKYVEWDRYSEKFRMAEISPTMLVESMSRYSMDEARELGRMMYRDLLRPSIEQVLVDFTLENAIEYFRRFGKYSRRFNFEDTVEGRKHVILLRHSAGLKWSAFFAGVLEQVFGKEFGLKIEEKIGPEVCSVKFELPEAGHANF
jgi:hypothetical protein